MNQAAAGNWHAGVDLATTGSLFLGVVMGVAAQRIVSYLYRRPIRSRSYASAGYAAVICVMIAFIVPAILSKLNDVWWNASKDTFNIFLGIAIAVIFQKIVDFYTPYRSIAYIMRNDNSFHAEIFKGCDDQKDSYCANRNKTVHIVPLKSDHSERLSTQVYHLRTINPATTGKFLQQTLSGLSATIQGKKPIDTSRRFDAVVIMSADPEQTERHDQTSIDEFYAQVRRLINGGTLVISIDTKFAKDRFLDADTRYLGYVSSNYGEGGRILGRRISELAREADEERSIVLLGSIGVVHEAVRQKELLYWMVRDRLKARVFPCPLPDSWNPEECSNVLLQSLQTLDLHGVKRVLIYACDDNIALALSQKLAKEKSRRTAEIMILGYNGQHSGNRFLVADQPYIVSTVDVETGRQGELAFDMITDALFEHKLPCRQTRYTQPALKSFI